MSKRQDRPAAVASVPETDEEVEQRHQRVMDEFWQVIQQIGERNAHLDPDEVLAEVTEVVEEVRQERYERAQREAGNCR